MKVCDMLHSPNFLLVILHSIMLFVILSILHAVYVSTLTRKTFKDTFRTLANSARDHFQNLDNADPLALYLIQHVDWQRIIDKTSGPSETTTLQNTWLYSMTGVICGFMALIVIVIWASCCFCFPMGTLLGRALVIIAALGVVEFLFFYYIVSKYIPSNMSVLVTHVFQSISRNLE